jgi:hypothetical protein
MDIFSSILKALATTQEAATELYYQPTPFGVFELFCRLIIIVGHIFVLPIYPILITVFFWGVIFPIIIILNQILKVIQDCSFVAITSHTPII